MNTMLSLRGLKTGAVCILLASSVGVSSASPMPAFPAPPPKWPMPKWQTGDSWRLKISRPDPSGTDVEFEMRVAVKGIEKVGKRDCAIIEFAPIPSTVEMNQGYRVFYDTKTGRIASIIALDDSKNVTIVEFEGTGFLPNPISGFPIEMLPSIPLGATIASVPNTRLNVEAAIRPGEKLWKSVVTRDKTELLRIEQRWLEGARWWTTYERTRNGKRDLTCRVVQEPAKASTAVDPPKPIVVAGNAPTTSAHLAMLRADQRLHARVTVRFDNPTLATLLQRLEIATGVSMRSTIENQAVAVFHSVDFHNTPAFEIMDRISTTEVAQGAWEVDGDGYRLDGPPSAHSAPHPQVAASSNQWPWMIGAVGLAAAFGCGLIWRKHRQMRLEPKKTEMLS